MHRSELHNTLMYCKIKKREKNLTNTSKHTNIGIHTGRDRQYRDGVGRHNGNTID